MSEFDGSEFYDLGLRIAGDYANEAAYRTAIGRVYYACYLVGVNATNNKGWFSPNYRAGDHSALRRALKDKRKDALADKLLELYIIREHADYHIKNRQPGECGCCDCVVSGEDLVGAQTWQRAEAIAKNILPKLESINPKKSRN